MRSMFWRRKHKQSAEADAGETDELVKLQKQLGITPVSDADVQGEFHALFGADGGATASGLSPTTERLLFGDDDTDDEEAKILRELQLDKRALEGGDIDEDHVEASSELQGVLDEAHASAQENHARNAAEMTPSSTPLSTRQGNGPTPTNSSSLQNERAAEVHALKMQALALKREGKIQEALAKFREAKELQAQYSMETSTRSAANGEGSVPATVAAAVPEGSSTVPSTRGEDEEDKVGDVDDVEVTDEDMQDPEFLAQLAEMGLADESGSSSASSESQRHHAVMKQLAALESQIHACKLEAVQHKRQNEIADALACMRKIKELEAKQKALRASPLLSAGVPAVRAPVTVAAVETMEPTHASAGVTVEPLSSAASSPDDHVSSGDENESDVEVTASDLDDPAFAEELKKLGVVDSDEDLPTELMQSPTSRDSEGPPVVSTPTPPPSLASSSHSLLPRRHVLRNAPSIDEDELIDAFDDESDSNDESCYLSSSTAHQAVPTVPEDAAVAQPTSSPPTEDAAEKIAELTKQLEEAKKTALALKRAGNVQAALESMRRAKQIENLILLKRQAAASCVAEQPARDYVETAKFQEIEQLLVDFANRAMLLAKENLATDRAKASEWLDKRKAYAAELAKLRRLRQNPLQKAPRYDIVKQTRQIKVELPAIPEDQVKVVIKAVNGLPQAAGASVFVKFCLNFPSSSPHEGQTEPVYIGSKAPFSVMIPPEQSAFQFKLARTRGTARLFGIKKAVFEIWKPGTLFRNPELVARGYQELTPLLTHCEVSTCLPFVGSNRRPSGGDVEMAIQLRYPLKEKEIRQEEVEELVIGEYPEPIARSAEYPSIPSVALEPSPTDVSAQSNLQIEVEDASEDVSPLDDPHHVDLIVSYDVINEEMSKIDAKRPSLTGDMAVEMSDRYDSLALKKQLLEIDMQTGKLTLDMYIERLRARITADRTLIAGLMASSRRMDAARVLHRVKIMEKELEGTEDTAPDEA